MEIKTFRARSMQDALQQIRSTLGPDASVLEAREIGNGLVRWLTGTRQVEVIASADIQVPTRLPEARVRKPVPSPDCRPSTPPPDWTDAGDQREPLAPDYCEQFRRAVLSDNHEAPSLVEQLAQRRSAPRQCDLPPSLNRLFTELMEAEVDEDLARELVEHLQQTATLRDLRDTALLRGRLTRAIEAELAVTGPIALPDSGPHVVALVGPTGVGKTTTIAKLAANFRLRERRRVGLITVDTYRVAAVEQLRTYADIIDLPMEVVSTPREIRQAVDRLSGLELILVDTAGRSPQDDVRIRELKSILNEAEPDEVHLVVSCVTGASGLLHTAERFSDVSVTALLLTKLDEAGGYGQLLRLARSSRLPFSYVTHGQSVPDDITLADHQELARMILGAERVV